MKNFYIPIIKAILYSIIIFYALVAILLVAAPNHKCILTLISCLSTICALFVCTIFSILDFSKSKLFVSILRLISFLGLLTTYISYFRAEVATISVAYDFISLRFDLFTSLAAYTLIVRSDNVTRNDR